MYICVLLLTEEYITDVYLRHLLKEWVSAAMHTQLSKEGKVLRSLSDLVQEWKKVENVPRADFLL